jgi:hypothetical protein
MFSAPLRRSKSSELRSTGRCSETKWKGSSRVTCESQISWGIRLGDIIKLQVSPCSYSFLRAHRHQRKKGCS